MRARRIVSSNKSAFYIIGLLVIVVAFLLLGGVQWIKDLTQGGKSFSTAHWNWTQILIGTGIGFLVGLVVGKGKW